MSSPRSHHGASGSMDLDDPPLTTTVTPVAPTSAPLFSPPIPVRPPPRATRSSAAKRGFGKIDDPSTPGGVTGSTPTTTATPPVSPAVSALAPIPAPIPTGGGADPTSTDPTLPAAKRPATGLLPGLSSTPSTRTDSTVPSGPLPGVLPATRASSTTTTPGPTSSASTTTDSDAFDFSKLDLGTHVVSAGMWQMNAQRNRAIATKRADYLAVSDSTVSADHIRIRSKRNAKKELWGSSADETVRTEILRDKRASMRDDEKKAAFNQRAHQAALIWKTGSTSLSQYGETTDDSEPLSAHTPGLKSEKSGGTSGALTKEHAHRDARRAKIVEKTLDDPSRGDYDVPIMSRLATIQLLSAPREELQTRRDKVKDSATPIFSQLSEIGDVTGSGVDKFDALTDRVQTVRETEKMHAALNLLIAGRESLVPATHKTLLTKAKGDVSAAMRELHTQSTAAKPDISFNTATTSKVPRLDLQSLREMSEDKSRTETPLSPVRKVTMPSFRFD